MLKLDGKKHVAITVHLLKHLCVAVLENLEKLFYLLVNKFLRNRGVYPLSKLVEKLLL